MDGVHAIHNSAAGYGWIPKGKERTSKTNTGRKRVNINGAYTPDGSEVVFRTDETINWQSTIKLFKQIERRNKDLEQIYVVLDNARYYQSKVVEEYLKSSKTELMFLPPYSPNLNLIERLWKVMKKNVLHNRYYESFDDFRKALVRYLGNKSHRRKTEWARLMTEKFHLYS